MKKARILWIVTGSILVALLVVFASAAFILPRMLDSQDLRNRILGQLKTATKGEAEFSNLKLRYLPWPRVELSELSIAREGFFRATADSISLKPRILPLFQWSLQIDSIDVVSPKVFISLKEKNREETKEPVSIKDSLDRVTDSLAMAALSVPALNVTITGGEITIERGSEDPLSFTSVDSRMSLPPGKLGITLTARSSAWELLKLTASVSPESLVSEGHLVVRGLSAESLRPYLPKLGLPDIKEGSDTDIDLLFSSNSERVYQAALSGAVHSLTFIRDGEEIPIRECFLDTKFQVKEGKVEANLSRLTIADPRINLTGSLLVDPSIPKAFLELKGTNTDVASVRKVALAVAGEMRIVQNVFDILREGEVPEISFTSSGETTADFKNAESRVLKGNIKGGRIFIPKVDLDVNDISGNVTIFGGILYGEDLEARTGSSTGHRGKLAIGLRPGDAPFHLDIDVDADLADLPPILNRLVKNDKFLHELSILKNVEGKASGKLILGDVLNAVQTTVHTGSFELSAIYGRLPFPALLSGSSFDYSGMAISARGLTGSTGKSVLSGASLSYDWEGIPEVKVSTPTPANILLDEFYPFAREAYGLDGIDSASGTLLIDHFEMSGSASNLKRIDLKLRPENVTVRSEKLAGPAEIKSGVIDLSKDKVTMSDLDVRMLDGSLVVSGAIAGYSGPAKVVDTTVQGSLGSEALTRVMEALHLPEDYKVRGPLKLTSTKVGWSSTGRKTLAGTLEIEKGPKVVIDVARDDSGLTLNKLEIRDREAVASMSLMTRKRQYDFEFSGSLSAETVNRILLKNHLLTGSMKGKFKSGILFDDPMNSTASGDLQVQGLHWGGTFGIESASLSAKGKTLDVISSDLSVGDRHLGARGSVDISPERFMVNMDVDSHELNWNHIVELGDGKKAKDAGPGLKIEGPSPADRRIGELRTERSWDYKKVQGILRVKIDRYTHGKFTWTPVSGTVHLQPDGFLVELSKDSQICGISTPGSIESNKQGIRLALKPEASSADLEPALECLFEKKHLMIGKFDFKADLASNDSTGDLMNSLSGNVEFEAREGRLFKLNMISKLFAMLNITEIYRGQLPDLVGEGCAYDKLRIKGRIERGNLSLEDAFMNGQCLRLVLHGNIDLANKKVDATGLASPFRTVDKLVGHIPVLGNILQGGLISIPFGVSGNLDDPRVIPLSPAAVGSELFGYMKRTFMLPFTLFQPLTQ